MIDLPSVWQLALALHGCSCPALAVGARAVAYALEKFDLPVAAAPYPIVCTAESFSCSIDAIQAILGCTIGNGKLRIQNRKRMAFRFCHTVTQRSVYLQLIAQLRADSTTAEEILTLPVHDLFSIHILSEIPNRPPNSFLSTACPLRSPEPAITRPPVPQREIREIIAPLPGYDRDW